ncbi:MAG: phage tail protein [Myxococcota bacterium]|nr:phage tail protein [Myxococcota bacterium]
MLPTLRRGGPPDLRDDYLHLRTVVQIRYPVRQAQAYLRRVLGNPVRVHLVESQRGEPIGNVRAIEVFPAAGGDPVLLRAVRCLPDGSEAGPFVPEELTETQVRVTTWDGRPPPGLGPQDWVILHVPVKSYMRFLPGAFQGAVPMQRKDVVRADEVSLRRWGHGESQEQSTEVQAQDADAMRRMLFIFQHLMTTVVDKVTDIPSITDPLTCDPRFLPWMASWVGFSLDESLPLHQQRELTRRAIRLYRTRGTKQGMEEIVKVLTNAPVAVSEREKPQPFVLGAATLAGGANISERYERGEPPPFYLVRPERPDISFFALVLERRERFQRRFSERAPEVLRRISKVVTDEKPAHVTFTIRFEKR